MNVIKIAPRGYCQGVISALNIVQSAAHDETLPRPIYVLGMIVHNEHITDAINQLGVITIDDKKKHVLSFLITLNQEPLFSQHMVSLPSLNKKQLTKDFMSLTLAVKM